MEGITMEPNPKGTQLLQQIREGMDVYDANGEQVGTVDSVHFGEPEAITTESDRGRGEGGGGTENPLGGDSDGSLFDILDLGLGPEANERMQRFGYITIDGKGLFSGKKFASSQEITSVSGNEVALSATKDAL
jgi:hypothetical protein